MYGGVLLCQIESVLRKTHCQRQKCKEGVIVNTKVDHPQGLERQTEEIRIVKLCYTKRGWFGVLRTAPFNNSCVHSTWRSCHRYHLGVRHSTAPLQGCSSALGRSPIQGCSTHHQEAGSSRSCTSVWSCRRVKGCWCGCSRSLQWRGCTCAACSIPRCLGAAYSHTVSMCQMQHTAPSCCTSSGSTVLSCCRTFPLGSSASWCRPTPHTHTQCTAPPQCRTGSEVHIHRSPHSSVFCCRR